MSIKIIYLGWIITILMSVGGSWAAMNARMYEVEARIRLIESNEEKQNVNNNAFSEHIKEGVFIRESLIRIEGKLDLKQDRFK